MCTAQGVDGPLARVRFGGCTRLSVAPPLCKNYGLASGANAKQPGVHVQGVYVPPPPRICDGTRISRSRHLRCHKQLPPCSLCSVFAITFFSDVRTLRGTCRHCHLTRAACAPPFPCFGSLFVRSTCAPYLFLCNEAIWFATADSGPDAMAGHCVGRVIVWVGYVCALAAACACAHC